MDLKILKTPFQAPQANAFCERWIGTVRRECLDFLIPALNSASDLTRCPIQFKWVTSGFSFDLALTIN
jgi:hypothetical protein